MKKYLVVILSALMIFSLTACFGSDSGDVDQAQDEVEEIVEDEEPAPEEPEVVVEPMIDQIDGLSMIRSYFLSINENQTCSELEEIAESCGFNVSTQYSGSELEVIGDGEVVTVEFRDDHVYEAWIKLSTNKWNVQFSPYGKAIKDGEMIDVQFYEVCFGNTLDDRNKRFDLDQGKEAFEYADSLDPIS